MRTWPAIGAVVLVCAPAMAIGPAVQITPRDDGLQVRSVTGDGHLTIDARLVTPWGRAGAQLSAARGGAGALEGTTRAWWQSELPLLGTTLRLGSLPARSAPLRDEPALKGLGLAGRYAPAAIDYGLTVGRLEDPQDAGPAASAWLQRRFGAKDLLALQARRQGESAEVGAVLVARTSRSSRARWALVQTAAPQGIRTRLLGEHRLNARRLGLQAQSERVVGTCAASIEQACQQLRADATLNLLGGWQLQWGRAYRIAPDASLLREGHVGATWFGAGVRFSWTLRQRDDGAGPQIGLSLSQPLGR